MTGLPRTVLPELLDDLPPHDRQGQRSRRDLRRINRIMLSAAILAAALRRHYSDSGAQPPRRLLELGAGDGSLMLALAGKLARHWPGVSVLLLDRQALVPAATV